MTRKLRNIELNRLSREDIIHAEKTPVILMLDDIRSLSNVGSLFRTSDALRLEKICLCGITGVPPHKEIRKTALGAEETVAWEYWKRGTECLNEYRSQGYALYALEQTESSVDIRSFRAAGKFVLVLGNEVDGVRQELLDLCDTILEIPQYGNKHSLNVSVAGALALWSLLSARLP